MQNSVTSIGSKVFSGCSSLTSITLPNGVTSINSEVFLGCTALTSIIIPNSVTSINYDAFSGCSNLTSIKVETGNANYDSRDNCNAIISKKTNSLILGCKSSVIPNSVTGIGNRAFMGCSGLTSIVIPNGVTKIGEYAFYKCADLTSVTIPNNVTSIGDYAFSWCDNLNNLVYNAKNAELSRSVFSSTIKKVTIGNDVEVIPAYFLQSTSITSITIPKNVRSIGGFAFSYCPDLASIKVEDGNEYFDSRNNCNAIISKSSNTLVSGCKNTIIPNSVTDIGYSAFAGRLGITSITIPNSVTRIYNYAFSGCKDLTSITIPNSVTWIGRYVFSGCESLTSITLPNSVKSIESYTFCDCSGLTSVTIPNSIGMIDEKAFYGCKSLTSITIPNSVTNIGLEAFRDCSALRKVTINSKSLYIRNQIFENCYRLDELILGCEKMASAYGNFASRFYENTTLFVPTSLYEKYRSSSLWGQFRYVEILQPINLIDGETFANAEKLYGHDISYTRNFGNTSWQALYIPFSMSYDDWKDDYEVAYINSIHQYDKDDDGTIDETIMEVVKIKNGSLIPNTPYLIRAKATGKKTFSLTETALYESDENSIECSTMLAKYTFTGTYNPIPASTLIENNYYAMGGGSLIMTDGSNGLKPFRWYMKIDARSPMYNVSNMAKDITINVVGEEETTGITNSQHLSPNDQIYDLNGRRVNNNNLKPGIYVKNGKKIIIK